MPVTRLTITEVHGEVATDQPILCLTYRLPDEFVGPHSDPAQAAQGKSRNDDEGYGGHQHQIPVFAVYSRMALYEEDKYDAVESIIAELLHQDDRGDWPTANQRAAAKQKYQIRLTPGVRSALDAALPDPRVEEVTYHQHRVATAIHEDQLIKMRGRGSTAAERGMRLAREALPEPQHRINSVHLQNLQ
jgi:hypothetical protein